MIKIIDYGIGNCGSIENMLHYLGAEAIVIDNPTELKDASAIILPGVGSFDHGVRLIEPFRPTLDLCINQKKIPFLGICLGMQLLFEKSDEGSLPGLGWLRGHVKKFCFSNVISSEHLVVPHMGWNEVSPVKDNPLLTPKNSKDRFYFVHSYHVEDVESSDVLALCNYGFDFVCAVQKDNIFGVQFHPEKSHKFGKQLFQNFITRSLC